MASSRKRSRNASAGAPELVASVTALLAGVVGRGERLTVGLSGGIDSVVLLDVLHRVRGRLGVKLSAVHVNHQLSADAGRWCAFCRRFCRARRIPFRSEKVTVTVARGDSLEAQARAARYEVFARQPCDYVVLAQHQDDQVETLLLQLLRGAGVKGLAGMPVLRQAEGGRRKAEAAGSTHPPSSFLLRPAILRPLLEVTRADIERYAMARGLRWVEDDSNADIRFQRNFLRHEVLPGIAQRFPAYRATVARAARHLAESAALLDDLAACDGAGAIEEGTLAVAALRRLSLRRARNLLRHFLAARGVSMPNAERLDEALRQLLTAKHDAQVLVDLGGHELRQFANRLHVVKRFAALPPDYARAWRGQRALALPEFGGVLTMASARGAGLSLAKLAGHPVWIRVRRGGERLRPDPRRPRRTLKNLMQEAHIPPWERERLPLVFCGRELAWAPVIGADCAYGAAPGERAVAPSWRPASTAGTS